MTVQERIESKGIFCLRCNGTHLHIQLKPGVWKCMACKREHDGLSIHQAFAPASSEHKALG
jgi:ribosomal protein L37AE/L43A